MDDPQTPHRASRPWRAVTALFVVTLIWGGTFVWMKQGLDAAQAKLGAERFHTGLALFLGLRFGLASLCLALFVPSSVRALRLEQWKGGLWIGGVLFAGFVLQMSGLEDVTPAVSAFLTSLYVLFTALCTAALSRRGPTWSLAFGALLATVGAGLIRGRPELSFRAGEWLTIGSAFVFALHILVTDRVTRRLDPMAVTLASLVWVTLGSAALLVGLHFTGGSVSFAEVMSLIEDPAFALPLVLSSLLATVIAISFMNVFQRELDPVRAAILYALEPIWAALAGIAYGLDRPSGYLLLGGSLLLSGNLIAEVGAHRRAS